MKNGQKSIRLNPNNSASIWASIQMNLNQIFQSKSIWAQIDPNRIFNPIESELD